MIAGANGKWAPKFYKGSSSAETGVPCYYKDIVLIVSKRDPLFTFETT